MASLQDFFVKIEGITGESKDSHHKDWIDALNFSYGVSQSTSSFTGGGSGVGKASFDSVSFTHYVDKTTPVLFKYCAEGKHIPKVELAACKSGGGQQEYMHVTLTDVIVTHAGPTGSTSDARITESVSLSYSTIKVEVKEQKADGSVGAAVTGAWDVKANKSI
ncbi:MAG: type VI secretion system tube protein Hcp [Azoarcus sp.]|jgi:type VI secretion system secreted protein Hcp|nr:type VI secretion system tube protein Hcp [Azoarcus sp.]